MHIQMGVDMQCAHMDVEKYMQTLRYGRVYL